MVVYFIIIICIICILNQQCLGIKINKKYTMQLNKMVEKITTVHR